MKLFSDHFQVFLYVDCPGEFTRSVEANLPPSPSRRGFVNRNVIRSSSQIVTTLRSLRCFDRSIP